MRISLKVEYAFRVLTQLSCNHGTGKWMHIEELAQLEDVPQNYLVQILNELRNEGLVDSRRGKQGGYILSRPPDAVSLLNVIEAIDPEMLDSPLAQRGSSGARLAKVFRELSLSIRSQFETITLSDLMTTESCDSYVI